ncbi:MAG: hypothetical protein ACOCXQ_02900 [Patescibacteria group bacterium]
MHSAHHLHRLPHAKAGHLLTFFTMSSVRTFAVTIVGLFLPIILYQNFLELGQKMSLLVTVGLFIIMSITQILFLPLITTIGHHYGTKMNFVFAP